MGGTGPWVRGDGHMEPPFSHLPTHLFSKKMDQDRYMDTETLSGVSVSMLEMSQVLDAGDPETCQLLLWFSTTEKFF